MDPGDRVILMLGPTTCLRSPHIFLPTSKRIEEITQYSIRFRIEPGPHAIHLQFLNTQYGSLATACCSNIDSSYLFHFEIVLCCNVYLAGSLSVICNITLSILIGRILPSD